MKITSLVLFLSFTLRSLAHADPCERSLALMRTNHRSPTAHSCANVNDLVHVSAFRPTACAETFADDVYARLVVGRPDFRSLSQREHFDPVELANGLIARLLMAWADRDARSAHVARPERPFLAADDFWERRERRQHVLDEDAARRIAAIEREYRLIRLYPLVVRSVSFTELEKWQSLSPELRSAVHEAIRGADLPLREYLKLSTVAARARAWSPLSP